MAQHWADSVLFTMTVFQRVEYLHLQHLNSYYHTKMIVNSDTMSVITRPCTPMGILRTILSQFLTYKSVFPLFQGKGQMKTFWLTGRFVSGVYKPPNSPKLLGTRTPKPGDSRSTSQRYTQNVLCLLYYT